MRATLTGLGFAGVLSLLCYQSAEAVPADGAAMKRAATAASTVQEAQCYGSILNRIEDRYGVPGEVLVAIWGWRATTA
jgi:membrane-bound lytic murein transglycosylase B